MGRERANAHIWNITVAAKGGKGAEDLLLILIPLPRPSWVPPGVRQDTLQHQGRHQQGEAGPARCQLIAVGFSLGLLCPLVVRVGSCAPPPRGIV